MQYVTPYLYRLSNIPPPKQPGQLICRAIVLYVYLRHKNDIPDVESGHCSAQDHKQPRGHELSGIGEPPPHHDQKRRSNYRRNSSSRLT